MCVRVIKMDGVDLRLFQCDFDQTWCAFLLNADGTIYGRYGTRGGGREQSTTNISIASFKKAMERALRLHQDYPGNKAELQAKRGPEPEYRIADKIPGLEKHHCFHCHQVREGLLRVKWQEKKLTAADIWPYPLPENIGLSMEVDDGLRVKAVTKDSPAVQAGIQPGDQLLTLHGQPLISQADIQWVLHRAPAETSLTATILRKGKEKKITIPLKDDWKESDLSWRASSEGLRYGLYTEPLSKTQRDKKEIPADALGLLVKYLDGKRAAPLKEAGLRQGDVIVAVDGKSKPMTETQFLTYVRLNHPPKDKVNLTVFRKGQRQDLEVPMW